MSILWMTDLPATIACSSSSRFRIQRRKQLVPCIKEKTQPSWLHFFWGEGEIAWEQNLCWVSLSTTGSCVRQAGPTTGKCAYSPAPLTQIVCHTAAMLLEGLPMNTAPWDLEQKAISTLTKPRDWVTYASVTHLWSQFAGPQTQVLSSGRGKRKCTCSRHGPPERSLLSQKGGDTRQKLRSTKRNEESLKKKKRPGGGEGEKG